MTTIYVVVSAIHLNLKYHNDSSRPVIVKTYLGGAPRIQETILKNFMAAVIIPKEETKRYGPMSVCDLDTRREDPSLGCKLGL